MATTKIETASVSQPKAENAMRAFFVKALSSEINSAINKNLQKIISRISIPSEATELFIKLKEVGFWYDFDVINADCVLLIEVSFDTSDDPQYHAFTAVEFKGTRPPAMEAFVLKDLWETNVAWEWRLYGTSEIVSIREVFPEGLEYSIPL